jgi:exosortase/archaeosortase family protein
MTSPAATQATAPSSWAIPVGLIAVLLYELPDFLALFFAPSVILGERWILAILVTVRLGLLVARAPKGRLHLEALWLAIPAAALALATPAPIHSTALAMYAFLLLVLGVMWLHGGRASAAPASLLVAALALTVYAPHPFLAPVYRLLLSGTVAAVDRLADLLFPDIDVQATSVVVAGETIAFVEGCAGVELLMTFSALTLAIGAGMRLGRVAVAVAFALALGVVLNLARIVTMIALGRAGFSDLAFHSGHIPLGHVFILGGALAILAGVERLK